ncbi:ABC-type nitrate/sulfonate/bicarbonate transport system, permease component (plasmid) [Paraburkholderia caribensis MBA4]|uniref:ABC-type nitrate/sulfonate/bicarbonate transport system, permease component n=1 Tax=Paraburkholderia caribensis MBA4 TaxID=1323664 RepID=A0A0P0RMV0_9BURK|nr:ABC-type nitrate/sulfonate/bicarbonate transport system, permease component [Paraburkholderia caribensis MBA4]
MHTGIRVAGAYSILVPIAAEMVGAKVELSYLVNYSQFTFEIPKRLTHGGFAGQFCWR